MSTEDAPKPAAWTFGASYWTQAESIPLAIIAQAEPLFDQATIDAAVAAANARWECALGAVMPADFKCWHQNAKSELPEIAAGVIENLRQKEADAWEQSAAAVAKERERIKARLMGMNDAAAGRHNYYDHAALMLFGRA